MTDFQPFVQERVMSKNEQDVVYNLADSGVHPLLLRELLAGDTDFINTLMPMVSPNCGATLPLFILELSKIISW